MGHVYKLIVIKHEYFSWKLLKKFLGAALLLMLSEIRIFLRIKKRQRTKIVDIFANFKILIPIMLFQGCFQSNIVTTNIAFAQKQRSVALWKFFAQFSTYRDIAHDRQIQFSFSSKSRQT